MLAGLAMAIRRNPVDPGYHYSARFCIPVVQRRVDYKNLWKKIVQVIGGNLPAKYLQAKKNTL